VKTISASPAFRYESDLVAVVQGRLATAVFAPSVMGSVETFTEVPARLGVPDVSAIRYDWDVVASRAEGGVRPLATEPTVRASLLLRRRSLDVGQLAEAMRMSKSHVQRVVVEDMRELGWLQENAGTKLRLKKGAQHAGQRVVTVEAKLRDWKKALGQARRQRSSADHTYIALDSHTAGRLTSDLPALARQGIGLIAVDPETSSMRIVLRSKSPLTRGPSIVGRTLMAERGLGLIADGRRAGQVYPVFGWTAPSP
jgi:hypothetical protein